MYSFLVVLEQQNGLLRRSSCDLYRYVMSLRLQNPDLRVSGVVIGPLADDKALKGFSADSGIFHVDDPLLALYQPEGYACVIESVAAETGATCILFADSASGADCAPRIAAALDCSLLTHCSVIRFVDGTLEAETAWYAGSVAATMIPEGKCTVMTVRPARHQLSNAGGRVPELATPAIAGLDRSSWNPVVEAFLGAADELRDITEARVIIAGGRGIGGPEGFDVLESLAVLLGGSVGASRSAVDEGWRPHSEQVGQTGKTVAPRLYVACGISGAMQHLAGIAGAETVVAINSDPDAPIFSASDYGIVGDVADVLPVLEALLRERIGKK